MACGRFTKAKTECLCSNCNQIFFWAYETSICEDCLEEKGHSRLDHQAYKNTGLKNEKNRSSRN